MSCVADFFGSRQRPSYWRAKHVSGRSKKQGQVCFTLGVVGIDIYLIYDGISPTNPTLSPRLTSQLTPRSSSWFLNVIRICSKAQASGVCCSCAQPNTG